MSLRSPLSLFKSLVSAAALLVMAQPVLADAPSTLVAGTLSVGSDITYPPYTYLEQGKPAGFDPEFMQALAEQMALQVRFVDTRFASLILGVNARRFDVVASALYVTPERARQVEFVPYLVTGSSLMVTQNSDYRPATVEALCGKRVGSIKGASWIPKLAQVSKEHCLAHGQKGIEVREFPTSPEAAQALLSRAVDVQFEDAAVAKITLDKLAGRLSISSSELLYPSVLGLALNKQNPQLKVQVEQAFDELKRSGFYPQLLQRYNLREPNAEEIRTALQPL